MKTKLFFLLVVMVPFAACRQKNPEIRQTQSQVQSAVQNADTMKLILARISVKPGKESEFIETFREMQDKSNKEDGCLSYRLYQDAYDKSGFIVVERYKNQDAIDYHFGTEYFKAFGPKTADLTSKPAEILIYDISNEKIK